MLVDQILAHKLRDSEANTADLESTLDDMVLSLYGLTRKEICGEGAVT